MKWVASVIITLAILYLRAPDIWPARFWAEDLYAFLNHAQHDGPRSLLESYAGYLHTVPRLISLISLIFPIRYAPEVFFFSVMFFTGWAASIIARSIGGFSGVLAGAALVLANGWSEPVGSVTNLQWLLAPALLILAIKPDGVTKAEGVVFAVLASTSGPFSTAFAPVYLFVLISRFMRDRHINFVAAVALVGGVIQLAEVIINQTKPPKTTGEDVVWLYGRIVELSAGEGRIALAVIALSALSVCFGKDRIHRVLLVASALLLTLLVVAKFRVETDIFITGIVGHRYWYVQGVIWLLVGFLAIRDPDLTPKVFGVATVTILVASNLYHVGISRTWYNVGNGWAEDVGKSYTSPVIYTYAPDWTVRLEKGVIYRAQ